MSPIESIKHEHLGASFVLALCDDKDCKTKVGPAILFQKHKGYEGASPVTPEERDKAEKSIDGHNHNHKTRLIIGHPDALKGEDGNSLTVYEK